MQRPSSKQSASLCRRVASRLVLASVAGSTRHRSCGTATPVAWRPLSSCVADGAALGFFAGGYAMQSQVRWASTPSSSHAKSLNLDDVDALLNEIGGGDTVAAHKEGMHAGDETATSQKLSSGREGSMDETRPKRRGARKGGKTTKKSPKKKKDGRASSPDKAPSTATEAAGMHVGDDASLGHHGLRTEPELTIADARDLFALGVEADETEASDKNTTPKGKGEQSRSASRNPLGTGWSYESVDPTTGKTQLETLYERNLDRIQRILEQPLPPLPPDGHVNPDFFIGFAHYDYRLRDEYRAIVASELRVPVRAVKLSVAWGGRFDVSRFNRVRKVCGVCLDRSIVKASSKQERPSAGASAADDEAKPKEKEGHELPTEIQERISALVKTINGRHSERLLQCQFLQASEAIPEVEFALTHREHRLLMRLHDWLRTHLLKHSLAVIVVGGNQVFREWRRLGTVASATHPTAAMTADARTHNESHLSEDFIRKGFQRHANETQRQIEFVNATWLKPFYNRHLIPQRVTLGEAAMKLARAIQRGEVPCTSLDDPTEASDVPDNLLPANIRAMLRACVSETPASTTASDTDGGATTPSPFDSDSHWKSAPLDTQEAALAWVHMVREALFLNAQHQNQHQVSATLKTSAPTAESASPGAGATRADADDSEVYKRVSRFTGDMPALFVHGAHAGGLKEMRYLQSNKAAMDALLLHPNDVTMKRAFASRMRNGHQKLRMHEELAASEHNQS